MTDGDSVQRGSTAIPRTISLAGVVLYAAVFVWWWVFRGVLEPIAVVLALVLSGGPALLLIWGGVTLERQAIDPDRCRRVAGWTVAGVIVMLVLNVPTMLAFPWESTAGNVSWIHFSITVGASGGFVVGYVEFRAITREVDSTTTALRASHLEDERAVLGYLNDLLRHEVLNSIQIVDGHASLLLAEEDDPETRDRLETIRNETQSLAVVVDDVRAMLEANQEPDRSTTVDLAPLLEDVVSTARASYPEAVIDATFPEDVPVRGNEGLRWVFSNLVENAIEHHDGETPHVSVSTSVGVAGDADDSSDDEESGEPGPDALGATADGVNAGTDPATVTVTVADDGPGIPPEIQDTLFERRSSNHGLGLYLAHILANRYDSSVDLADTGPDGTTFTVTLTRVSDDAGASAQRRRQAAVSAFAPDDPVDGDVESLDALEPTGGERSPLEDGLDSEGA